MQLWTVFWAAMITAIFTGFGAIPFFFIKKLSPRVLGYANALAAGLMLGASIGLIIEGSQYGILRTGIGIALGILLVIFTHQFLEKRDDLQIGAIKGADAKKMLLIVGVMTVHSFAEGIGVGVSFGGGESLGALVTSAIAIHNIPEGLAISLVLIPIGTSVWGAAGWSVFSSLPQPLMAVAAYAAVLYFAPFLPAGLGLAAGAMIWMVFSELVPEAEETISTPSVGTIVALAVVAMLGFQQFVG